MVNDDQEIVEFSKIFSIIVTGKIQSIIFTVKNGCPEQYCSHTRSDWDLLRTYFS